MTPTTPTRTRRRTHPLVDVAILLGLFAIIALAGWLIDYAWPAAVALIAGLWILAARSGRWLR